MHRVTLYSLSMPPTPMLYQDFERHADAVRYARKAKEIGACHVKIKAL